MDNYGSEQMPQKKLARHDVSMMYDDIDIPCLHTSINI